MKNNHDENMEFLYKCISVLDTPEECKNFLEDICTKSELIEISRRLKAARMLSDGAIYAEIAAQTGLSTATISRVNHCIKYGNEGYLTALKKTKL